MKIIKTIAFALLILTSCTEVIDISTKKSEPELVVEANISENNFAEVLISKSIQLTDDNVFQTYANATVELSDNEGNIELLHYNQQKGKYHGNKIRAKVGNTYYLNIIADNKTITSSSKIPTHIGIDSVWVINSMYPGSGKAPANMEANFYEVNVRFTDPINEANYYRILISVNHIPLSSNNVFNDMYSNGLVNERNIVFYNETMKNGDTITVELQTIDKSVFKYFQSMGNASMRGNTASPANPYTNLTGTKLGYFNANSNEVKNCILVK